jgi:hypothetical protein
LHNREFARLLHLERQREIERRLRFKEAIEARQGAPRPSVRRRLGYQLIRLGWALAYDGLFQLSARR